MKCFLAMAFDNADTDQVFDEAIEPVLNSLHIRVLRVDREEHNDDIDDKIFEFLNAADFCIADLTYARPSVYYEAGYAFGQNKRVSTRTGMKSEMPRRRDVASDVPTPPAPPS
jgi:nucleoside 2-deoxyribosyltransferase